MQVKVSARHGHLNEELQSEITAKVEKLLQFFERLTFIEVTVDLQHPEKDVEIVASAEHAHKFVAHGKSEDLQAAVNMAVDKASQQIKHYKDKIQDKRSNGAS